jgi:hypothetical protein
MLKREEVARERR